MLTVLCPSGLSARGINRIIDDLEAIKDYHSEATVDVQLPQGTDVSYSLKLWSTEPASGDTLAPCSYLIEWKLPTPTGESTGFTAYNNRHLYRHIDTRLQEYHYEWDSIPFLLNNTLAGVQRNSQFTNVLPQFVAEQLREITTSPNWKWHFTPDTINNGLKSAVLTGSMIVNGYTGREVIYVFDPESSLPRYIETENNPTSISEQTIIVKYSSTCSEPVPAMTEETLAERYPDVFDSYRENNFTVETLRGKQLPAFSLPTTTGERYQHQKGDRFPATTLIAMLDPSIATASETVKALRDAADMMPRATNILFTFIDTNIAGIESCVPDLRPGEHLLTSARSLARDCGVTSFPTIIIAGSDGTVKDIIIGFNKDLSTVVIEKSSFAD